MYDFTILVLQGAFATSLASTLDILSTAAVIAPQLGLAKPRWRIVSQPGGLVNLSNGLQINTTKLAQLAKADASLWIIPGLGASSPQTAIARIAQTDAQWAAAAIKAHAQRGSKVAASCSAVFLLQAAGLLAQRAATCTWWLAPHLRALEPSCHVDAKRMVIADRNVITAGAALAHTDLMLYLLRQNFGVALADAVSRVLLIDTRIAQSQYVIPSVLASGNELITQLSARIEAALPKVPSMGELARAMAMSERTLARHVVAATGLPPMALVQQVRLSRARTLLQKSRMPVEQVAEKLGYADATALRRMMKKATGATPRQLRGARVLA